MPLLSIAAGALGLFSPLWPAKAEETGPRNLHILSFNVRYNNPADGVNAWPQRKEMVAQFITNHRIDLAGLQEALDGQIEDLKGLLPDYGWIGVGRDDGKRGGEFTPIFFNRKRLTPEEHGTFWLSERPENPGSKSWDASLPRIATWGIFRDNVTGLRVFLINTHFDHKGEVARKHSVELLLRKVIQLHRGLPVIVTGDFNATPDSAVVRTMVGDLSSNCPLRDARVASRTPHKGGNQTFNGFQTDGPKQVLDYILVGPGVQVRSHGYYRVVGGDVFISDHWPVMCEVVIGEREAPDSTRESSDQTGSKVPGEPPTR